MRLRISTVNVSWRKSFSPRNKGAARYDHMEKPVIEFELPAELEAHLPPELRGLRRDQVRLLVLPRVSGDAVDTQFDALGEFLAAGDLLVVNNSRTLPALLLAHDENGAELEVRLATHRADNLW